MSNKATEDQARSELVTTGAICGQKTIESKSASLEFDFRNSEEEEFDNEEGDFANSSLSISSVSSVTQKSTSSVTVTSFFTSFGEDCNNFFSKLKPAPMIRRRPSWTRIFGSAVKLLRSLAKTIPR